MPSANPLEILGRWIDGVNAGEVGGVADLYADDSILLATFAPDALRTRAQIEDYFGALAARGVVGVILDESSVVVQALGGDCYALIGRYTFQTEDDDATDYPTRFTFIMDTSKPRPILHHHSSQIPQP